MINYKISHQLLSAQLAKLIAILYQYKLIYLLSLSILSFNLLIAQDSTRNPVLPCALYNLRGDCYEWKGRNESPLKNKEWVLVLSDEFDKEVLDTSVWHVSRMYGDEVDSCMNDATRSDNIFIARNPANVSVSKEGYLKFRVTEDNYNNCLYSGAEVTTYCNDSKSKYHDHTAYHNFKIYPNSYLEMRVKMPEVGSGVGLAIWLINSWGNEYQEIDVVEVPKDRRNYIKTNYHWMYKGIWKQNSRRSYFVGGRGDFRRLNISQQWVTYGLKWESDKITWYVNQQKIRELDLTKRPPRRTGLPAYRPTVPMVLRFGAGKSLRAQNLKNLPQEMWVDYVRLYRQKGDAIVFDRKPTKIDYNNGWGGAYVTTNYYPKATYKWSSPTLKIGEPVVENPKMRYCFCEGHWVQTPKGIATDTSHLINLTVSFPSGYEEVHNIKVRVE